jgi:hypothetical protein
LPFGQRFLQLPPNRVFERVTGLESFNRNMFFPQIAIQGGVPIDLGSHILNGVEWGFDNRTIRFGDPDILEFEMFHGCLIGEGK